MEAGAVQALPGFTEVLDHFDARRCIGGLALIAAQNDLLQLRHRRDRDVPGDRVIGADDQCDILAGAIDLHGRFAAVEHIAGLLVAFV